MRVVKCNQPVYIDVDNTLVMWDDLTPEDKANGIAITCPISKAFTEEGNEVEVEPWTELLVPHKAHIEMLKQHKLRGHTIIVWSAGGWEWAEAVVKALQLEKYVDVVLEKPMWFYDDLKSSEFMPEINRIYKPFRSKNNG